MIAHLDMDAFYASVELRTRPDLRGKPVIVCGSGPRAVVTTASYEARAFGVHSAMPASQARRLCPHGVCLTPNFEAYRAVSREIMDVLASHVELVEVAGLDEAYLDLGELLVPNATMRRIVAEIRERTALTCSVGIGESKLLAKLASELAKPAGLVRLTREQALERFAAAPPRTLPGVGPRTAERLHAMGIGTLAQLREHPLPRLQQAFGERQGAWLRRRAGLQDDGSVRPHREIKSQSAETTFDRDIADLDELCACLASLASRLSERLRSKRLAGRGVAIKVRLDDWTTVTRARSLAQATDDAGTVAGIACELLRLYAPARPVRLLGVQVAALQREGRVAGPVPATAAQLSLPFG